MATTSHVDAFHDEASLAQKRYGMPLPFRHSFFFLGVLEHSALKQIWKPYPTHLHEALMLLMEKFQIAFALEGDVSSLVNVVMQSGPTYASTYLFFLWF